jgi:hypothetical protein
VLFSLVVLVAVAGPGPAPRIPIRGVGCRGGGGVRCGGVPKVPLFKPPVPPKAFEMPKGLRGAGHLGEPFPGGNRQFGQGARQFGEPFRGPGGRPGVGGPIIIPGGPPAPPAPGVPVPTGAEKKAVLDRLASDLGEVEALANKGDWAGLQAARLERPELPRELNQALRDVDVAGKRLQVLHGLNGELSAGKVPLVGAAQEANLPESVQGALEEANNLANLQAAVEAPFRGKPNVEQLEKELGVFAAFTHDPEAARSVRIHLAQKAAQEGHADEATQLLRDVKPVKDPGPVVGPPKPPPVGLLPEAGQGISPARQKPASDGLPPLKDKVATAAKQSRERAAERVRAHIEQGRSSIAPQLQLIHVYRVTVGRLGRDGGRRDEERRPGESAEAAIARLLGRPLTPTDKILIVGELRKGKRPGEIAKALRELDDK